MGGVKYPQTRMPQTVAGLTNQKVDYRAEDDGGDGAHGEVTEDFRQKVRRYPVVATDVLMPATRRRVLASESKPPASNVLSSCRTAYTNRFLSVMKSSAADTVLKHWLVVMKKRAPILQGTANQSQVSASLCMTNTHGDSCW